MNETVSRLLVIYEFLNSSIFIKQAQTQYIYIKLLTKSVKSKCVARQQKKNKNKKNIRQMLYKLIWKRYI